MRKLLLVAAMALCVAGCAQLSNAWNAVTGATITADQVYIAANSFDALEASATNYLKLPPCGTGVCRSQGAVNVIVPAIRSGRLARNKLEAAVNANPGAPVDANLFHTLTSSTDVLKAILAEYGVK